MLTKSRTAVLAAGVGCAMVGWQHVRGGRRVDWRIPLAVVALFAVSIVGAAIAGAFDWLVLIEAPKSLLYRFEYWQATLRMIADHPWLGCGPGNFQQYYTLYKLAGASETIADPHNFLLEIWATTGTLGFSMFAAFLALLVWRGIGTPAAHVGTVRDLAAAPCDSSDAAKSPEVCSESVLAIWIGALAGGLLAFPVGTVVGFPPAPALLWLGLPAGAAIVVLLRTWVVHGTLPPRLLLISMLTLLLNLTAAGGIGFAGVAVSFWLLAALVINRSTSGQRTVELPRWGGAMLAGLVLFLLAACHQTMYAPVLTAQAKVSEAIDWLGRGRLDQAESSLRQAAEADAAASQPWIQLAALYHAQLLSSHSPELQARFDDAVRLAQTRNKRSFSLHRQIGNWRLALFRRTADRRQLEAALEAYRTWVDLYPTSNLAHAQLAWIYHLLGNHESAAEQAVFALRLDAATPHQERKLAVQQVYDADGTSLAGTNAEQLMQKLRSGGSS
jgi:Tfp pilus assembly protein PilF